VQDGYDPPLDLFENNNNIKRKNTKVKAGIVVAFAFDLPPLELH
jgi:hypothetical protein